MRLTLNRPDITGLVFEIPLVDGAGTRLYSTTADETEGFLSVADGGIYPCGNHGLGAGGNVKCFLHKGTSTHLTTPTRIVMTDFTYTAQMNCRFLILNPNNVNAFFSVKVKAFGGDKTETNLYGDKFLGEWDFTNIFQVIAATGTNVETNTYNTPETRLPSKSPYRNETIHYVFSKDETI